MSSVSVTVLLPAWVGDRGASRPDWDNATSHTEVWRNVQPVAPGAGSGELHEMGRQGVTDLLWASCPADSVLTSHARVVHDGETYEVEGSVRSWKSITGGMRHVEAYLKRVEG